MIRIGLIGAGKHGLRYIKHLSEDCPDMQLTALARRDAERGQALADELGCRAFTDYRELIEKAEIDAVIIAAHAMRHGEMAIAAVKAGRAVLLEKPCVAKREAALDLQRKLAQKPVPFMVAHTLRYNSVVRCLKQRLDEIGAIHSIALTQRFERSPMAWLDDPQASGGGIILHTGVHSFDLLRVFTGLEANRVTCQMRSYYTRNTEDNFAASVKMAGGPAIAAISGSRAAPGRSGYIELAGERGTLVANHVGHWAQLITPGKQTPIDVGEPVPTVREVLKDFARLVRGEITSPIPLLDGLRAVAIAHACYDAARSGRAASVARY